MGGLITKLYEVDEIVVSLQADLTQVCNSFYSIGSHGNPLEPLGRCWRLPSWKRNSQLQCMHL